MMRSVQRVLAVFESFTAEQNSLSLHELSQRIELPKSTAFRFLQSLEKAGYLVRLEDQRYCLSFRFTRLAGMVRSTLGVREIARPIMVELAQKTEENVTLHTVSGNMRVCIDAVATAMQLRSVTQPGEQVPLTLGATSKLLVAHMTDKQQATRIIGQMARTTKRTQAQVRAELTCIKERGCAASHGERVAGLSAISAPVKGVDDAVHYCLTVAGPTVRVQANEKAFIKLVVGAAADVSRLLGAKVDVGSL